MTKHPREKAIVRRLCCVCDPQPEYRALEPYTCDACTNRILIMLILLLRLRLRDHRAERNGLREMRRRRDGSREK